MPYPEIHFLMWKDDVDLWNLLTEFTSQSRPDAGGGQDVKDKRDSGIEKDIRDSGTEKDFRDNGTEKDIRDSGTERDFMDCGTDGPTKGHRGRDTEYHNRGPGDTRTDMDSGTEEDTRTDTGDRKDKALRPRKGSAPRRRMAYRAKKSMDKQSREGEKTVDDQRGRTVACGRRSLTARVVVLGDDRVLGRLCRSHHSIREKESKQPILSKSLDLQLYYVPVTDRTSSLRSTENLFPEDLGFSLASHLGKVDPWYDIEVCSLGATISDLSDMPPLTSGQPSEMSFFLLDTLCYFLRCGTQPVKLPLYRVKMTRGSSEVTEVFVSHLEAEVPEFRHLKDTTSTKRSLTWKLKAPSKPCGGFLSISYSTASSSRRDVVKGEATLTFAAVVFSEPASSTAGEDFLSVQFLSLNQDNKTRIQTRSLSIRTLENRTLDVVLDRDVRRRYTHIHRLDISPCLDPADRMLSRFSSSMDWELPERRHPDPLLHLPLNTFTGARN